MKTPQQQPLDQFQKSEISRGLGSLQREVAQCERDHGWLNDPETGEKIDRNWAEAICLMHSELSEALESVRNSEPLLWYEYPNSITANMPTMEMASDQSSGTVTVVGKPQGVASELADTIIRILAFAEDKGIPVVRAVLEKHNYNLTRPYRHGGKTA